MRELLVEVFAAMRGNRMRIALTGFSIGWGIFILIVLLSSGRGLVNGMHHNFKAFNIGVVTVHKRDGSFCVLFALIVDNLRVIHNFILLTFQVCWCYEVFYTFANRIPKSKKTAMNITISTDEYMKIQQSQSSKDVLIAQLEAQVADMKNDCDYWKNRALKAEEIQKVESNGEKEVKKDSGKFIVISVERLKAIFSKIHDLSILAILAFVIQKTLHRDDNSTDSGSIADLVSLPQLPTISLTADGNIEVEGNWNDIHHNGKVNL